MSEMSLLSPRRFRYLSFGWCCSLRHKIPPILPILIRPTVHLGYFPRPIPMSWLYRRRPLQCIRLPWVLIPNFFSLKDRRKEIVQKDQLRRKCEHCYYGYKVIQPAELIKGDPPRKIKIPSWHS